MIIGAKQWLFSWGFLRHWQESLNIIRCEGNDLIKSLPSEALFNATCIRISLSRLLPSRACLRFTGCYYIDEIILLCQFFLIKDYRINFFEELFVN